MEQIQAMQVMSVLYQLKEIYGSKRSGQLIECCEFQCAALSLKKLSTSFTHAAMSYYQGITKLQVHGILTQVSSPSPPIPRLDPSTLSQPSWGTCLLAPSTASRPIGETLGHPPHSHYRPTSYLLPMETIPQNSSIKIVHQDFNWMNLDIICSYLSCWASPLHMVPNKILSD